MLASRKRESFVNPLGFRLRLLIKKHTDFVTTDCCARRSDEPPGFFISYWCCSVVHRDTRWNGFLSGTAGFQPAFPSTIWLLTSWRLERWPAGRQRSQEEARSAVASLTRALPKSCILIGQFGAREARASQKALFHAGFSNQAPVFPLITSMPISSIRGK